MTALSTKEVYSGFVSMGCMAGGGRGSMGKASARRADVIERGGREKEIESHLRDQRYR